jgi:transposase
MSYRILSLFGLQGLEIINILEYYKEIFLYVVPRRKTANCPFCDKRTKYIHQYRPPQVIKHYRLGKRQTFLVLFKRRFFCKRCNKVFMERVYGVKKWQRKTQGLDEEIIELLRESSFLGVKRRLGVNYQSQIKLLKQTMKPFESNWERELNYSGKFSLGIDEHSFSGHDMVLTITNLTLPRLVSILPNDKQSTLNQFIFNIPKKIKSKLSSVCIDMNASYAGSIRRNLPEIPIVIDHFHVIQDANKRIDEERRILQNVFKWEIPRKIFIKNKEHLKDKELKTMRFWFKKLRDLESFWQAKETLRDIYKLKNRKQAEKRLDALLKTMWDEKDRGLTQWANTLYRWRNEILNFFDHKITNAYTEGIHTKCKLIKRIGFGFKNKEVYIRKVALACLPLTFLPHFFK